MSEDLRELDNACNGFGKLGSNFPGAAPIMTALRKLKIQAFHIERYIENFF